MNIFLCASDCIVNSKVPCISDNKVYNTRIIRILPLSNWASSELICKLWNNQSMFNGYNPDTKCTWRKTTISKNIFHEIVNTTIIQLVESNYNIDYYIIINWLNDITDYKQLNIPLNKTIVFHMEPYISEMKELSISDIKELSISDIKNKYQVENGKVSKRGIIPEIWRNPKGFLKVCDHKTTRNILEWHISPTYMEMISDGWWENLIKKKNIKNNTTIISTILSNKNFEIGHQKRIEMLKTLLSDKEFTQYINEYNKSSKYTEFKLDIYGTIDKKILGIDNTDYCNYCGELPYHKKDNGLFPYKYHFNAENNDIENYNTEKLVDGILSGCCVFYWGNRKIFEILDERCCILLPFDKEHNYAADIKIIKNSIRNREWEKRLPYIKKARDDILHKYQFFPFFFDLITK